MHPLKGAAIPDPNGVQAFIGARQAGIGDMIKEDREAMTGGHLVAKLKGDTKQNPGAEGLPVFVIGIQLSVMHRGTQTGSPKKPGWGVELPDDPTV